MKYTVLVYVRKSCMFFHSIQTTLESVLYSIKEKHLITISKAAQEKTDENVCIGRSRKNILMVSSNCSYYHANQL